jgi:ABC-2 type transport system ATP-binding protein
MVTAATTSGTADGATIQIDGLRKQYGRLRAVDGLSMHVEKGSIFGFVGPNGAGKTTTMRILATLISADSGVCKVTSIDVSRHPATIRAKIGYMPDYFGVYDDLTVQEYLSFYAESHGVPSKKRRATIADLLELIDLEDKRYAYVESLSRGMKQRLGLARCLVHDPEVLLLDEPASGMDPRARLEMREILRELQRLGKTVLVSSHILPELAEMCTHIGIVQAGRLIRQGPVSQMLQGVRPGRTIEVRALGDRSRLAEILSRDPRVTAVEPFDGEDAAYAAEEATSVSFQTFSTDAGLRDLLRMLVENDIEVVAFAAQRDNLEAVFMQLTEQAEE